MHYAYFSMVQSGYAVVSRSAVRELPDAYTIRLGPQRRRGSAGTSSKAFAYMPARGMPAPSRLQRRHCFTFSEDIKAERRMKPEKAGIKGQDFKVWCEHCCIRIAPHEETSVIRGKTYHPRCYSKVSSLVPKTKA